MLNKSHLPIVDRSYPQIEGTVIAFDFGEKRIGVAVGETAIKSAHAHCIIDSEVNSIRFNEISRLIADWHPCLLIVGLPMYLDGKTHQLTHLAKKFAQRLEGRFNLPVMLIDERLSSAEASQHLSDAGIKGRKQKEMIDAVAAQVILQSYFDSQQAT